MIYMYFYLISIFIYSPQMKWLSSSKKGRMLAQDFLSPYLFVNGVLNEQNMVALGDLEPMLADQPRLSDKKQGIKSLKIQFDP